MANPITRFLDKLTGIEEPAHIPETYDEDEYVTVAINEQQMKHLEETKYTGQMTVRVHKLKADNEYDAIIDMVRNNTIVVLDISLVKNSDFTGLKMLSNKLKQKCDEMRWGLGALNNDLLIVTPASVRFEKRKIEESIEK